MKYTTDVSMPYEPHLASKLHKLTVSMHEPSKRLQIYKRATQRLVLLCESYALSCLHLDLSSVYTTDYRKHYISVKDAQSWFRDIGDNLKQWASWDLVSALTKWGEIEKGLERIYRACPSSIRKLQQEQFPSDSTRIFEKPSVEETLDAVRDALSSKDSVIAIMRLQGSDSKSIMNLLDRVMYKLEIHGRLRSKVLHTLRKLCAEHASLPDAFILPKNWKLVMEKDHPEASGGFADVWLGNFDIPQDWQSKLQADQLESNAFAEVWSKQCDGKPVAVKAFRIYGRDNLQAVKRTFCREAVLWKHLSHPNIAPFIGIDTKSFSLSMICEWMENGNITAYLKAHPGANRLELLVDVAQGLEYLHSIGVLHADLKGANILVNDKLHACLTDFGLTAVTYDANTVNAISTSSSVNGSVRWMAPEVFNPEQAGLERARPLPESDIYSFAMVIWEIFTGCVPYYDHLRDPTVVFKVILGIRPERPPLATRLGLSDMVWELMEQCWQGDWRHRPRISTVLQTLREAFSQYGFLAERPPVWPLYEANTRNEALVVDSFDSAPMQDLTLSRTMASSETPTYPAEFLVYTPSVDNEENDVPDYLRTKSPQDDPDFLGAGALDISPSSWDSVTDNDAWY